MKLIYKFWIGIIVVVDFYLMILPITNHFEKYLIEIIISGFAFTYFSVVFIGKRINKSSFVREVSLSIAITVFALISFHQRTSFIFNHFELETVSAKVENFAKSGGWRRPRNYIIKYSFLYDGSIYNHQQKVTQAIWANYITKNAHDLNVDVVVSNPEISRINQSSLTELPEFERYKKLFY